MSEEGDRRPGKGRDADLQEAADWFARWQAGTVDEAAFARWRNDDPAHALAFARVTAIWEAAVDQPAPAEFLTRRQLIRGGMFGAVVLATGMGLVTSRAYAWDNASTGIGETRKLRLPDDSMVELNTDTALSWRFSQAGRELWLERGEVAIDLRPGPAARLRTRNDEAALSHGRFDARLRTDALELTVLRGSAMSSHSGIRAGMQAGAYQRLSFADRKPAVASISRDAVEASLAWQSGDVVFLDAPLAEAASEYNRYLLRKIVIDDPTVGGIRVGGRFTSSDPTDFLHAVSTSLGLHVRMTENAYVLDR